MKAAVIVLGTCLLTAACDGPTGPALSPSAPPPVPTGSSIAALAGEYDLSIDLAAHCAEAAGIAPTRVYHATMGMTSYSYLSLGIGPAARGDLWPNGTGSVRISLNNFDIGGCDGAPEPLPDGRLFNICGAGVLAIDGSTISGTVDGTTWIGDAQALSGRCVGPQRFTFRRRPS